MAPIKPPFQWSECAVLHDIERQAESHTPTAPNLKTARAMLEEQRILDGRGKPCSVFCDLEQFRKYGPGVYLIFKFLKYYLLVFAILQTFAFVNLILLVDSEEFQFDDANFQSIMESTVLSYGSAGTARQVLWVNYSVILIFALSILLWKYNQKRYILDCSRDTMLSSYYTVILRNLPTPYAEQEIKEYLENNFGKIKEIYTVKNYGEDLVHYAKITRLTEEYFQMKYLIEKGLFEGADPALKLVEAFLAYRREHSLVQMKIASLQSYQPTFAFISFESMYDRQELVLSQQTSLIKCGSIPSTAPLFKGVRLRFQSCEMEPKGIIWENINISQREAILRYSLVAVAILTFFIVSVIIIFLVSVIESSLYKSHYLELSKEEILNLSSVQALQYYCLNLSLDNMLFDQDCYGFRNLFATYSFVLVIMPFLITFMKAVLVTILKKLVHFCRYKYEIHKVETEILIVSILYFIKAGVIKLLMYREFQIFTLKVSLLRILLPLVAHMDAFIPIHPQDIQVFTSFTNEWITHASHKVIMIALISFNISIFLEVGRSFFMRWLNKKRALKQPTQERMNQFLRGEELNIEFVYAQMLSCILFTLLYFPIMPVVLIFSVMTLFFLYWTVKAMFVKCCRRPPIYNHSISRLAFHLLILSLIMNCLVTPLYFQNEDLQERQQPTIQQYLAEPEYLVLLILTLIYYFFHHRLEDVISKVCRCILRRVDPIKYEQSEYRKSTAVIKKEEKIQSYSMHDNEEYKAIIDTIYIMNRSEEAHSQLGHYRTYGTFMDLDCYLHNQFIAYLQEDSAWELPFLKRKKINQYEKLIEEFRLIKRAILREEQIGTKIKHEDYVDGSSGEMEDEEVIVTDRELLI